METVEETSSPLIADTRGLIYGLFDSISKGYFPNASLLIHIFNILCNTCYEISKVTVVPPSIEFLRQRLETYDSDDPASILFSKLGGIPLVLQILAYATEHKEYEIEANCLAILMALTRTMYKGGNKVTLRGWGGLPLIVKSLYSPFEASQFWACAALRNIARSDYCKQKIGQLEAIQRLLVLITSNNDNIKSSASSCLVNMSINRYNKGLISPGIPLIIERMKSNDVNLIHDAVWILSNLASVEENRIKIVQHEGVNILIELLNSDRNQILERVASAIQNLACNDMVESMVVSQGGIERLIKLFERNSPGVTHATCGALNNLTWKESHKDIFVKSRGIPTIVNLLFSQDTDTLIYATSILWNISYKNNENICSIISHGALERLVELINNDNEDLKNSSMGALQNMACEKNAKVQILASKAVRTLINHLRSKNPKFVKKAENILMNILNIRETVDMFCETDCISLLFTLIKEHPNNHNARCVLSKIRSHKLEVVIEDQETKTVGNFEDLLNNAMFSDVTIKIREYEIKAHKAILFSRCDYWQRLFTCGMKESQTDVLTVPCQYTYESVLEFVRFIYSNCNCNLTNLNVVEILELADYYGIADLVRKCEVYLFQHSTMDNFSELLELSVQYNAYWLRTALRKYALYKMDPLCLDLNCIRML